MSAASMICEWLTEHGEATRPEMQRQLGLHEKAVETAIRKLIRIGCISDTGRRRHEGGPNSANIFALGSKTFDQRTFTLFDGGSGRPRKVISPVTEVSDLGLAIAAWRQLPEVL